MSSSTDCRYASALAFYESRKDLGAKTPALPKERIKNSKENKKGSSKNTRGGIKLTEAIIAGLKEKADKHNEKHGDKQGKKVTLGMLKAVWRRGAGAFSATHRPGMSRQQWAMGRVNAWLKIVRTGKPDSAKYTGDNDLLPKGHPRKTEKRSKDCGTGTGGFKKGNTCSSSGASAAAKGAAKGAATGAAIAAGAGLTEYKPGLAAGAAVGAVGGAIKGYIDHKRKPKQIMSRVKSLGTSDKKVESLVKSLGGSKDSVLDLDGKKNLTLKIKDTKKKLLFNVDISSKSVTVYPRCDLDCLNNERVGELANFASKVTKKKVKVAIKKGRGDYTKRVAARLTKAGFKAAAKTGADFIVATFAIPQAVNAVDQTVQKAKRKAAKK